MEKTTLEIANIVILPEFITRDPDPETVTRYREVLDRLPDIEVWLNPETGQTCLINGWHRLEAHRVEHCTNIRVAFLQGTYEDMVVRSRTGNLDHGLAYSAQQWRQAIRDIVKARHSRTNAWIAREARCSDATIARIRTELEKTGEIPWMEFLLTESGQMRQRQHRAAGNAEDENLASVLPDVSFEEDEDEARANKAGREDPARNINGTYPSAAAEVGFKERADCGTGEPTRLTLKLTQVSEPLILEAGLWIDGRLQPIPVTLLVSTTTPPQGMPEISPEHENCLVISRSLAQNLHLMMA